MSRNIRNDQNFHTLPRDTHKPSITSKLQQFEQFTTNSWSINIWATIAQTKRAANMTNIKIAVKMSKFHTSWSSILHNTSLGPVFEHQKLIFLEQYYLACLVHTFLNILDQIPWHQILKQCKRWGFMHNILRCWVYFFITLALALFICGFFSSDLSHSSSNSFMWLSTTAWSSWNSRIYQFTIGPLIWSIFLWYLWDFMMGPYFPVYI